MLRQLTPNPDRFEGAYSDWIQRCSELMASSAEGTTFGIFGPWGSGKTSATMALKYGVPRAARSPLQPESELAVAYVDCSSLRSALPVDVSKAVRAELVRSGLSEPSGVLEENIFTFFRSTLGIAKTAMVEPVGKFAAGLGEALAEKGLTVEDERQRATKPEISSNIEKAFIFLDDLDRCDANAAWTILRHAHGALLRIPC